MPGEKSQNDSQLIRQNNDPDGALPSLNDRDLQLLVSFFQQLDDLDRQPTS